MYQIDIFLRINETSFFPQLSVLFFNRKEGGVHEIFSKKKMEMKICRRYRYEDYAEDFEMKIIKKMEKKIIKKIEMKIMQKI